VKNYMRNENDDDCDDEDKEEENTVVLREERCRLEVYGVRIFGHSFRGFICFC
jgi:hypothetical protein